MSNLNLEGLTRQQLIELAKLCEDQENAYDEAKLDLYEPHPLQEKFHKSQKKIRCFIGGNRVGKTTASFVEASWIANGVHPYRFCKVPNVGKLYALTWQKVMETFAPKIKEFIPRSLLNSKKPFTRDQHGYIKAIHWANGSVTEIGSYEQQAMTAEGGDYDYVGFDEPPPRALYIANLRGLIDRDGFMWFSMTPLSEPWIFDELWVPGLNGSKTYVDCFNGASDENPHINLKALQIFLSELTDAEKEIRYEGKFAKLKGLVIDTYKEELSLIEPFELTSDFVIYEGLDPHANKPNRALWKAVDRDGFRYSVAELDCDMGIYNWGIEIAKVRRRLVANGARLVKSVTDTSLNVKDMQFKINQLNELKRALTDEGETLMPVAAHKRGWLLPGIKKLRDLFRPIRQPNMQATLMPTEFLFKGCVPKYEYELNHYRWPEKPTAQAEVKPIKADDESIDCSRYIESVAPEFVTPGESQFMRNYKGAYRRAA